MFPGWQNGIVGGRYHLCVHPELNFIQQRSGTTEMTLLGFIIDPHNPEMGDEDILACILREAGERETLFRATYGYSGRWIIFYDDGANLTAFHDPCGLRSLYYTNTRLEPFMCASQPGLIASTLGLRYSDDAQKNYLDTPAYKDLIEYWLPSGSSLYEEVEHLVPNHYLDIETRVQTRFWPWEKLEPVDYQQAVSQCSQLLENMILAASNRYPLAVTVTAGYDTRIILAATREISTKAFYYSLIYYQMDHNSPDIAIPQKLLRSLGLEHNIIDCRSQMDDEFKRLYHGNVELAHPAWGDIAFGMRSSYPQDLVTIKGSCSEVARCFYHRYEYPDVIDGERLTTFAKMQGSEFAVKYFSRWLKESFPIAKQNNIDILDLFYWEHRLGSWQAMSQLEWDIVQEEFAPFACRELLVTLLGVDERYRKPPDYRLYRDVMRHLWPEVLDEPINPKPFLAKMKKGYPQLLRATPVYQFGRKLYRRLFKR